MKKSVKQLLEKFEEALGTGLDLGDIRESLENFIKGTESEQRAASAIAKNVANTVALVQLGQATPADVKFALERAKEGAIALAEAKVIRLKVAAIRVFFEAITLGIVKLL